MSRALEDGWGAQLVTGRGLDKGRNKTKSRWEKPPPRGGDRIKPGLAFTTSFLLGNKVRVSASRKRGEEKREPDRLKNTYAAAT